MRIPLVGSQRHITYSLRKWTPQHRNEPDKGQITVYASAWEMIDFFLPH